MLDLDSELLQELIHHTGGNDKDVYGVEDGATTWRTARHPGGGLSVETYRIKALLLTSKATYLFGFSIFSTTYMPAWKTKLPPPRETQNPRDSIQKDVPSSLLKLTQTPSDSILPSSHLFEPQRLTQGLFSRSPAYSAVIDIDIDIDIGS